MRIASFGLVCQALLLGSVAGKKHLFQRFLQSSNADRSPKVSSGPGELPVVRSLTAWEASNPALDLFNRAFSGSPMSALVEMLDHSGAKELWSDPAVAHQIVNTHSYLQTIKGVEEFSRRRLSDMGPGDGLIALNALKDFMVAAIKHLDVMGSPQGFAKMALKYSEESDDPEVLKLLERMGNGDQEAALNLQQLVVNKELGDFVDLRKLGFDGSEPEPIKAIKEMMRNDEADIWGLAHKNNPYIKDMIEDPYGAAQAHMAFAKSQMAAEEDY